MKLERGQKLFEALQNVCDFTALESDMEEILRAVEEDNSKSEPCQNCVPGNHDNGMCSRCWNEL